MSISYLEYARFHEIFCQAFGKFCPSFFLNQHFVKPSSHFQIILHSKDISLRKIPYFYLISWCGSFVERHSFHIVSSNLPETMWKLCLSTKFPHQEIKWNYGILHSVSRFFILISQDYLTKDSFFILCSLLPINTCGPLFTSSVTYRPNTECYWPLNKYQTLLAARLKYLIRDF